MYVVLFLEWFVEEGKCVYGDVVFLLLMGMRIMVVK